MRCLNAPEEFGVILQAVLEPVVLRTKADQHTSRAPMPGDDDLLSGRLAQVAGEVILDFGQSYLPWLVYPPQRASAPLRASR